MSYERFTVFNKNFSLCSVNKKDSSQKRDIEESTKKIIDYLNSIFNVIYSPNQALSIDEGMCKCQGRYSLKTYVPNKPVKIGMKFYIITDSKTGYVLNFQLYNGKYKSIKNAVL
jgi:hypothetical protein